MQYSTSPECKHWVTGRKNCYYSQHLHLNAQLRLVTDQHYFRSVGGDVLLTVRRGGSQSYEFMSDLTQ